MIQVIETNRRYQCIHCGKFKRNVDMEIIHKGRGMCYICFGRNRWSRREINNILQSGAGKHPSNFDPDYINRLPDEFKKEMKKEYKKYLKRTGKSKHGYKEIKSDQPPRSGEKSTNKDSE